MPSCVVKICKNNSTGQSKCTKGITFHKFPRDEDWKNKWIRIVRASRGQPTWMPSRVSVLCSDHFDDHDIYTTKKGNRRIKKKAVPVCKLFENNPDRTAIETFLLEDDLQSVHTNTEPAYDKAADVLTDSKEQIQKVIIKVEPSEYVETSQIGTQTNYMVENNKIKEEPKEDSGIEKSVDPLAQQHNSGNCANVVPESSDCERELEVVTAQLNDAKRKTKMLLEKLNRSQKRNLKMKNILKEIKLRKLIDRDVFRELTASLFETD